MPVPPSDSCVFNAARRWQGALNRRRSPCHALAFTRVRTRVRSYTPPQLALPPTPSSPLANSCITVRRLDMLLAPTARRGRFFVRGLPGCGPSWPGRHSKSPGEELGRARVGLNPRGLRSNPVPCPCVPAQLILHCARRFRALGELLGPLRSRRDAAGAGPDAARPAAGMISAPTPSRRRCAAAFLNLRAERSPPALARAGPG